MRSIEDIATTGAAWVTEAELAMLCAFAKRAEKAEAELAQWHEGDTECCLQRREAQCARAELEAEVERLRNLDDGWDEVEKLTAELARLRTALASITNCLATSTAGNPSVAEAWEEARAALRGGE